MAMCLRRSILLLFTVLSMAATGTAVGQQAVPVQVELDHAAFAYDADASMLETYLAFDASTLRFEERDADFVARLPLELELVRSSEAALPGTPDGPVWQDSLLLQFPTTDTSALESGQYFVHQLRVAVAPGEYELRVAIPGDAEQGRSTLELRRDVLIPDYDQENLVALSDVTLASTVQPSEQRESPFYKNGLEIRPNANQLYGQGLERLYYYAEVYRPEKAAGPDGRYTTLAYISEANRAQPAAGLERRVQREARTPDVLVGSFDLGSLPSGSYFLRLVVLDAANEAVAEQSRKFFVYNPNVERNAPVAVEASFETSPFAVMTEEQVAAEIEKVAVIAADREMRRFRSIEDLDERRRYLMAFWQLRDPDPATPVNEFRETFFQRIQYANDRYSTSRSEGWKTERGRVIVKYGLPSNIEPHLYDRDTTPHEIWQYHNIPGEGQAFFVFADRNGFGQFEMIHATVSGELSLPNWREELVRR